MEDIRVEAGAEDQAAHRVEGDAGHEDGVWDGNDDGEAEEGPGAHGQNVVVRKLVQDVVLLPRRMSEEEEASKEERDGKRVDKRARDLSNILFRILNSLSRSLPHTHTHSLSLSLFVCVCVCVSDRGSVPGRHRRT